MMPTPRAGAGRLRNMTVVFFLTNGKKEEAAGRCLQIFYYLCREISNDMQLLTRFLFAICLIYLPATAVAESTGWKRQLAEVDRAVAEAPRYVAQREASIGEARNAFGDARQTAARYECALRLYELYKPFISDSAFYFLQEGVKLAEQLGDRSEVVRCRALMALRCSNIGMYDEALMILDSISTDGVSREALGEYYRARNNVYNELAYYTRLDNMRATYQRLEARFDSLMQATLPADDPYCFLHRELHLMNDGQLEASLAVNDQWLRTVTPGSHPYALVALYRYLEYMAQGDSVQMMHWLCESVLADVRNGVLDQGSMWELANQLMIRGDNDRAYRYINFTMDCAGRYGSRQRLWQNAPLMNDIAKNYKAQSERTTRQLWVMLGCISVLAVLLLCVLFFLNRRNRQLDVARKALNDTNARLAALNDELKEANSVKDEYIGRFLSLCAQYVDKLDNYRKMVNRKMKNKELDELFQITKSTELKEREIEELNHNFDSVFLHLFPHFVSDINALLLPEYQIHLKDESRLTTDLRIFALIRLGIDDSSKIAEFLHYSVNTIYNYRARLKNGAVDNRGQFERKVKEIGMLG